MGNPAQVFGGTPQARGPIPPPSTLPDHWRMARAAQVDLLLMGMPRVNLLLIAPDGVARFVLESLSLNLHEPIVRCRANEPLTLPRADEGGTLVLQDVGAMTTDDQLRLLDWLERAKGRTQVVSTSSGPVLPRVHSGDFIERLYYRLNTVCVDVTPS